MHSFVVALVAAAAVAIVLSPTATSAPSPATWDKHFGNDGTVRFPIFAPLREQSVASCSADESGRVHVLGSFGRYVSSQRRSALAQIERNGRVVRSGGKVWRRTPLIREDMVYELTDGSFVYVSESSSAGRVPTSKLKRITASGRPDANFGKSGSLAIPAGSNTSVFAVDGGQFIVARQSGSTTVVRRYTSRGGLVRRFGGDDGVRVEGEVLGASSIGRSGSIVLVTWLPTRTSSLLLEVADAEGDLDTQVKHDGVAKSPEFVEKRSRVEGIVVRDSSIYLLVSGYPTPNDQFGLRNYRIVKLDSKGEYVESSGVVDEFGYPGDSGEPDEFERKLWITPRGILYARMEQFNSRSTIGRFSLWSAKLTSNPKVDRTIGKGPLGITTSRYFIGQKLAVTADGKSLIVCGSTATYSPSKNEHRTRVALRRLEIK